MRERTIAADGGIWRRHTGKVLTEARGRDAQGVARSFDPGYWSLRSVQATSLDGL